MSNFVHADEPLIDKPEDELGAASPADGITMRIVFDFVEDALVAQCLVDHRVDFVYGLTREFAETVDVNAVFVQRRDRVESVVLTELEVLGTRTRSDMNYAGAFILTNFLPFDDSMCILRIGLRRQVVERSRVTPTDHCRAGKLLKYLVLAVKDVQAVRRQPQQALCTVSGYVAHLYVLVRIVHCRSDIGSERPRGGSPDQQLFASAVDQWECQEQPGVYDFRISLGCDFMLRHACATSWAPRHDILSLVEPSVFVAGLQETPDAVVVLVGLRVIRIVPIHEITESL